MADLGLSLVELGNIACFVDFSSDEVAARAYGNGKSEVWGGPLPHLVTMDIPVVFGQMFWLEASLEASSYVHLQAPALSPNDPAYAFARSGQADTSFMHTLAWNGVGSLLDSTGQPVAQYGLWSASGTDYRVPYTAALVPEPAAAWLMLAGVIGLAGVRRLRRSAHERPLAPGPDRPLWAPCGGGGLAPPAGIEPASET